MDTGQRATTIPSLADKKRNREPIVMITAYDAIGAQIADEAGVDIVLVGDTVAMTVLGYDATVPVTLDEMLVFVRAVRRGLRNALLVADMPFGSYEPSDEVAISSAIRLVKEGGCDAVKLERGVETSIERVRAIVDSGIPVMGHVGLTPQTATALGGYRVQGRTEQQAIALAEQVRELQAAGCFALVFEAIPATVTTELMRITEIPVIGIGAGPATDGQVLVYHDVVGLLQGPRFAKQYGDARRVMSEAVRQYADEVRKGLFPDEEHSYSAPAVAAEAVERAIEQQS